MKFTKIRSRTAFLLSLGAAGLFLLFLLFQRVSFAPDGVTVHPDRSIVQADARLNLNTASASELQELSGIGPTLSEAIVTWRTDHGGFRSVEELLEVPGIGEKTLAGIRDYVYVYIELEESQK